MTQAPSASALGAFLSFAVYYGAMQDDYAPERPNHFVDIPEVSDATVKAMLVDLVAAGHVARRPDWPEDPEQRTTLRLQIMGHFWRKFGRPVWIEGQR